MNYTGASTTFWYSDDLQKMIELFTLKLKNWDRSESMFDEHVKSLISEALSEGKALLQRKKEVSVN